jgi:WD40 repeat protein/serine/threonine protein kinase
MSSGRAELRAAGAGVRIGRIGGAGCGPDPERLADEALRFRETAMGIDFQRLEQILADAVTRTDPAERAALLDQACGEDRELRAEVERLLAAHERAGDFLEAPIQPKPMLGDRSGEAGMPRDADLAIERVGSMVGRYKLLEEIGEGGFGVVYMAEQVEPVQRKVALKIIKAGMDTRQVIARFEAERQALALMDHPNIAKVFDGGATQTGRPYFVMELVRGIPITEFCDQRNLSTGARLKLFIQVCHAVQHAHQKGIIHRDLKPSNILVTLIDGEPLPKVIDFGVAKAMGQRLTDQTLFTGFLQMVGTPVYMSPEQADLSGLDVDTRADIYALGVLLYELLAGVTPFDGETLRKAALDEIRRMIREAEPPKPSTRLRTLGDRLTNIAKHRHSEPAALHKLVRGDLDWIVMKCLEKDRRRRYETASDLAGDIERHLKDQPVLAGPPGTAYRARKFIRRHRLGIACAAAVASALATGLSAASWMFLEESRARQRVAGRAYITDLGTAMRAAAIRKEMGGVVKLLAAWEHHRPDLRGWEWYYLNGLCHAEILTIQAERSELCSVAWSPDGTLLATGGAEGTVKIWDALSGRQTACLRGHTGDVRAVAWSPDGRRLASASRDKTVQICAVANTREVSTLLGHSGDVACVAWSPNGERLASGSRDGTIRIWDPLSGANAQTILAQMSLLSLSWGSDGTRLAASGFGEKVKVWDLPSDKELWGDEVPLAEGNPLFCAWSPDGKQLATGGNGRAVKIRDATTGTHIKNLGGQGPFSSIAWAPRGEWLAAASHGSGIVTVWDTMTGGEVQSFVGHVGGVRCACWRPDGARIASAGLDGTVKVWDTTSRESSVTLLKQSHSVTCLAWRPDGSRLAFSSGSSVWILDFTQAPDRIEVPGRSIAWNCSGTRLACGDKDGVLRVWDPANHTEIWHVQVSTNDLRCVAWSPDSKRLATAARNGTTGMLAIWDAATGKRISAFPLRGPGYHRGLAWCPDGSCVAAGTQKDVQILEAVSGRERGLLKGHADVVGSVAWSPDSKRLASAASDASVKIWDASSGRETQTLLGHAGPVREVAWHPDGTRLVSAGQDKTVIIWEPAGGLAIGSLGGHEHPVTSVAWSPDGTRLASSDSSGMIRILDSTPGRQRHSPGGEGQQGTP